MLTYSVEVGAEVLQAIHLKSKSLLQHLTYEICSSEPAPSAFRAIPESIGTLRAFMAAVGVQQHSDWESVATANHLSDRRRLG